MTPGQIEDAIRTAAALMSAIATGNPDDAEALLEPGPSWCLAIWLSTTLKSEGADPIAFAGVIISDSVAHEASQDPP